MKENKYDDPAFFNQYKKMNRSINGLEAAGEWHELKKMLPDFTDKRVLDLGCGMGWHCRYAESQGAKSVVGIDLSAKMLQHAKAMTQSTKIDYIQSAIEDSDFPADSFDCVISSLAFHYVESFQAICQKVYHSLSNNGSFVFSVEHPIFTAEGQQDWYYNEVGQRLHWPVDCYFTEGLRRTVFLGEAVSKYHRTLTTYLTELIKTGFDIVEVNEPMPEASMLKESQEMQDELRRPMMLLISARKQTK